MNTISRSPVLRATALSLCASMLFACASTPDPTIDTSEDAVLSYDGMYPVNGGSMGNAWARADFSVEHYSKIMLRGSGIAYKPGGSKASTYDARGQTHYVVTDKQKAVFEEGMREAFVEELGKGKNYEIVTEPGPDVLLLNVALVDVVSYVPPRQGSGEYVIKRVGEATLIFELRDSESEAILLRAADRKAADDSGMNQGAISSRANNMAQFKLVARSWASDLREGLDRFMIEGGPAGE